MKIYRSEIQWNLSVSDLVKSLRSKQRITKGDFVVLNGVPGAGKSTFIEHFDNLGYSAIDGDILYVLSVALDHMPDTGHLTLMELAGGNTPFFSWNDGLINKRKHEGYYQDVFVRWFGSTDIFDVVSQNWVLSSGVQVLIQPSYEDYKLSLKLRNKQMEFDGFNTHPILSKREFDSEHLEMYKKCDHVLYNPGPLNEDLLPEIIGELVAKVYKGSHQ